MKDKSRIREIRRRVIKPVTLKLPYIGTLLRQRDSLKSQLAELKGNKQEIESSLEKALKEKQEIESNLEKALKEKQEIESSLEKALKENNKIKEDLDSIKNRSQYQKVSYSQDGEDQVLYSLMNNPPEYKGFYVDIGAFHPLRFSNTQLFYEKGWQGLNIDATPGSMEEFKKVRKRDINIEASVSESGEDLEFFSFKEPALNSFDRELSEERIDKGWELIEIKTVKTYKINDLLSKHITENRKIDFINIDIEGLDLSILKDLDWGSYSPDFLLFEALDMVNSGIIDYKDSEEYKFFESKGYEIVGKTRRTLIFKKLITDG
jgi:FkbM family methyltransferase